MSDKLWTPQGEKLIKVCKITDEELPQFEHENGGRLVLERHLGEKYGKLGQGIYSKVYSTGSRNFVRKLNRSRAYNNYVKWLWANEMHKQYTAFPNIVSALPLTESLFLYRIERLVPLDKAPRKIWTECCLYGDPRYRSLSSSGLREDEQKALLILHECYRAGTFGTYAEWDLGDANTMYRPQDDSIVFIDPVCGY